MNWTITFLSTRDMMEVNDQLIVCLKGEREFMRMSVRRFCFHIGMTVWASLFLSCAMAKTYYVDYEGGQDSNAGTTMNLPLKHCPGDPSAAGNTKNIQLEAGDVVIFKGGVAYKGEVTLKVQGTQKKPVIIDGNTEGTFGTGRAIIEGGEPVDGWKKCANADEAMGNPQWAKIWYTDNVATSADPYTINLCQKDLMFHIAVYPCSDALAIWNDVETALKPATAPNVGNKEEHFFSDPYFNQESPGAWKGAFIAIRAGANRFYMTPVTRFVPESNQIYFKAIDVPYYNDLSMHRFAMLNALQVLTRPGQYVLIPKLQDAGKRLYCWPMEGSNFPEGATISSRPAGIIINSSKHLIVRGFLIQHQVGDRATGIRSASGETEYLTIEDNHVRQQKPAIGVKAPAIGVAGGKNLVVRKNKLNDVLSLGTLIDGAQDVLFEENVFNSVLGTTVDFYRCKNVQCLRNRISGLAGLHANGLTFYLGNENVLVEGNIVAHENALTLQELDGIRVVNNVFDGIGRANGLAIWAGKPVNNVVIEHNTIVNATHDPDYCAGLYTANKGGTNWVVRNNIIDGADGNIFGKSGQISHNLFLRSGSKSGGDNAIVELDANKVFVNPANGDYRLKPGSPAIGAGVASEVRIDITGKTRNIEKPDLGAYQSQNEDGR